MPQFIDDFIYGAKVVGEHVALIIVMIAASVGMIAMVFGMIWLAKYIAGNNPFVFLAVLPIQIVIVGGFAHAFYKLIPRAWNKFCKNRKARQQAASQKKKFQRILNSIEQR